MEVWLKWLSTGFALSNLSPTKKTNKKPSRMLMMMKLGDK
jgi:hypothetical protein